MAIGSCKLLLDEFSIIKVHIHPAKYPEHLLNIHLFQYFRRVVYILNIEYLCIILFLGKISFTTVVAEFYLILTVSILILLNEDSPVYIPSVDLK